MNNLIKLRKEAGLSQEELSAKLGVTQQTISKYERGIREPDLATLLKLSELFNCSIDYIIGKTNKNIIEVDSIEKVNKLSDEIIQLLLKSGQITEKELKEGMQDKEKERKLLMKLEKAIEFATEIDRI